MTNQQGFSLIEVLISLLLLTTTSLALLNQQRSMSQVLNQIVLDMKLLVQRDNHHEKE